MNALTAVKKKIKIKKFNFPLQATSLLLGNKEKLTDLSNTPLHTHTKIFFDEKKHYKRKIKGVHQRCIHLEWNVKLSKLKTLPGIRHVHCLNSEV